MPDAAFDADGPDRGVLAAFPRRPLAVRARPRSMLGILGAALMALLCVGGAVGLAIAYGRDLVEEARIWETGRPVPALHWEWRCRTQLVLGQCNVQVSYAPAPGKVVTHTAEAMVFVAMDDDPPPAQVKVDPADPDRFATSLLVDERPSRWLALGLLSGGLLLLAAVIGGGAWAALRQHRLWRALARDPHPVAAEVTGMRQVNNPVVALEVRYRYAWDGAVRSGRQRLRLLKAERGAPQERWVFDAPLQIDPGGSRALALAGPKGALLVPASFEPLVLTEDEKARLRAAQAGAGVEPP